MTTDFSGAVVQQVQLTLDLTLVATEGRYIRDDVEWRVHSNLDAELRVKRYASFADAISAARDAGAISWLEYDGFMAAREIDKLQARLARLHQDVAKAKQQLADAKRRASKVVVQK